MLPTHCLGVPGCTFDHDSTGLQGSPGLSGGPECPLTGQREQIGREPDAETNLGRDLHGKLATGSVSRSSSTARIRSSTSSCCPFIRPTSPPIRRPGCLDVSRHTRSRVARSRIASARHAARPTRDPRVRDLCSRSPCSRSAPAPSQVLRDCGPGHRPACVRRPRRPAPARSGGGDVVRSGAGPVKRIKP